MRLVPFRIDILEADRPGKGDLAECWGVDELYRVDEIGMKYYIVHIEGNPLAKRMVKITDLHKYTPPEPDQKYALLEEFPRLLKRR